MSALRWRAATLWETQVRRSWGWTRYCVRRDALFGREWRATVEVVRLSGESTWHYLPTATSLLNARKWCVSMGDKLDAEICAAGGR